jgi:tRNA A37 threonylcarbamoyladenosine dehydratase
MVRRYSKPGSGSVKTLAKYDTIRGMVFTSNQDRFMGFTQLVGQEAYERISRASVCVVGLGGVGSWTVEALARCGVGAITLVDLDEVCVTNVNRQLHALTSTVGTSKAEVLEARVREINPECSVRVLKKFFSEKTAEEILGGGYSLVLDTIDTADHKVTLLAECARRGIPAITVGSAGNRTSPTTARVEDLSKTIHDPLLQIVRKRLRQDYDFPRSERTRFDIPCVYAPLQRGSGDTEERHCGTDESQPKARAKSCNAGLGSAVFMTGTIGFIAAAEAISFLSQEPPKFPYRWFENRRARLAEPEAV